MDIKEIKEKVSISSRVNLLDTEEKKKIAEFLMDYCFIDSKEVYTNGSVLVPMFRVLDALIDNGNGYGGVCSKD